MTSKLGEVGQEDEDDTAIRLALEAMHEAWETPWVRELIEKRALGEQEDKARLERAHKDGWSKGRFQAGDLDQLQIAQKASWYAIKAVDEWKRKYPRHHSEPSPEILSDPERYRWWLFDQEKSETKRNFYFADFCRDALANYFDGYAAGLEERVGSC